MDNMMRDYKGPQAVDILIQDLAVHHLVLNSHHAYISSRGWNHYIQGQGRNKPQYYLDQDHRNIVLLLGDPKQTVSLYKQNIALLLRHLVDILLAFVVLF